MSAIAILDNPDFKNIFQGLSVNVISRRTAMRRVSDMQHEVMQEIKEQLNNAEYVCTTADVWSGKKRSFMGITCHWINNKIIRQSAALACRRFKGTHSYDKIAEIIEDIHSSYNINNKVVATITDNGSKLLRNLG